MSNSKSTQEIKYDNLNITNILLAKIANDLHILTQKLVFKKELNQEIIPVEDYLRNSLDDYIYFLRRVSYDIQDKDE